MIILTDASLLSCFQPFCREAMVQYARDVEEEPDLDRRIAHNCLAAEKRFCQGIPNSIQRILADSDSDEEVAH